VRSAARGRSPQEWTDLAERDLTAVAPRSKTTLRRLAAFRKRLRAG
jgi:hypothetical protein